MRSTLSKVVGVDDAKCKNCHACITVCPVKYCIDGSGDTVRIDHDRCIGCGRCIDACSHHARYPLDDSEAFFRDLDAGAPLVALVAPAAAAGFAERLPQLVGWLRASGAKAVFDASFGAELCTDSYLRYVEKAAPPTLIAQPCPAIVTYIELYRPELLKYLAPIDSPILHSAKMIRSRYPEFAKAKIAALTPCLAKKREFEATGVVAYNVTFLSVMARLEAEKESLTDFAPSAFDGPLPERASGFPSPGGLMRTIAREAPGIAAKTRTMEGPENIYPYLDGLSASIASGIAPAVVDCLNCGQGCICGPGGRHRDLPIDLLKNAIDERVDEPGRSKSGFFARSLRRRALKAAIASSREGGDFARSYVDRSAGAALARPKPDELKRIYVAMEKHGDDDIIDCSSCGYGSCEGMAVAIHNGLNKAGNCHRYQQALLVKDRAGATKLSAELHERIVESESALADLEATMRGLLDRCASQAATVEESSAAIESMIRSIREASSVSEGRREALGAHSGGSSGGRRQAREGERRDRRHQGFRIHYRRDAARDLRDRREDQSPRDERRHRSRSRGGRGQGLRSHLGRGQAPRRRLVVELRARGQGSRGHRGSHRRGLEPLARGKRRRDLGYGRGGRDRQRRLRRPRPPREHGPRAPPSSSRRSRRCGTPRARCATPTRASRATSPASRVPSARCGPLPRRASSPSAGDRGESAFPH